MGVPVEAARSFLVALGTVFAFAGVAVAWAFERLLGMGLLIVGAFLLILPFLAAHSDE